MIYDNFSVHDRSLKKRSCGFVGGFGAKFKYNDKLSIGADIMWKWQPNLINKSLLPNTPAGDNLDAEGFNRTYCAKHKTNTNFSLYVTTKIF
jgi:hypothetical protein